MSLNICLIINLYCSGQRQSRGERAKDDRESEQLEISSTQTSTSTGEYGADVDSDPDMKNFIVPDEEDELSEVFDGTEEI